MRIRLVVKFIDDGQPGRILFKCPGCECMHYVNIGEGMKPLWEWDGNVEMPTFKPSIKVSYDHLIDGVEVKDVCHFFVKAGRIEYLSDSTHKLSGQTVDMVDIE
jgi:hypothetical protein